MYPEIFLTLENLYLYINYIALVSLINLMSRRNISKKRFPEADPTYNSYLASLLISRIIKSRKQNLAQNMVQRCI